MKRHIFLLLVAVLLAGCASQDLHAPCKHPAFMQAPDDCGPLQRFP